MKEFFLPVISFAVGMISLYVDSKDKRKKWIFIFCLFITLIATIVYNVYDRIEREIELKISQKKEEYLSKILMNITNNTNQIPDLVKLLAGFGYTLNNAMNATPVRVNEVINANKFYYELLTNIDFNSVASINIEYFPKDVDQEVVISALKNVGFTIKTKQPFNRLETNAIWVGNSVTIDEIKMVALILFRAGVDIISIRRFKNGQGNKHKTIQIGSDPDLIGKSPLRFADIMNIRI